VTSSLIKPKNIRLEAAAVCQLKCPACRTGRGELRFSNVGTGTLRKETFLRLIEANPWIQRIELSNWGEIFLNKDLADILRLAYEKRIRLRASNGVNLNTADPAVLEAVVKYRVRRLTCSIDGASQETYSKYRVGGDFDTVISNVRQIVQHKKAYATTYPRLTWQFIIFGHNEHELPRARRMANELGMKFSAKLPWNEAFSPVLDSQAVRQQTRLGVASRREFTEKAGSKYLASICLQLWNEPQVNFDGKLLGCCVNTWSDFGNALDEGLLAALNNERMRYARRMLTGDVPARDDIPCTQCNKYKHMQQTKDWITREAIAKALSGGLGRFLRRVGAGRLEGWFVRQGGS
jgi:hypothetical protein